MEAETNNSSCKQGRRVPTARRPREACRERPEWRRRGEGVGRKRKKRWEEDREKGKGEIEEKKQWYVCEREHTKGREVIKRGKGEREKEMER